MSNLMKILNYVLSIFNVDFFLGCLFGVAISTFNFMYVLNQLDRILVCK